MEVLFYFILMYLITYYIPCTESEKCYDQGYWPQCSSANCLGPRAFRRYSTASTKDPHQGSINSLMITIILALSGGGPAGIVVIIFLPDCTPYSRIGKQASYIKNRMNKRKPTQYRETIIYSDSDACSELAESIFSSTGLGITKTLEVIEEAFTEA